ncbi:hypothetical protein ACFSCX_18315 [Bacillus salitolerans]|uniref:Histidine kinase n=1 Tax=Bacillus salitolerans TaxID=1437434 RepID=A0ABW4LTH9_9BACI
MRRLKYAIPIMIIVFFLANRILNHNYAELADDTKLFIAIGGSVFSGIVSFFMLAEENEKKTRD